MLEVCLNYIPTDADFRCSRKNAKTIHYAFRVWAVQTLTFCHNLIWSSFKNCCTSWLCFVFCPSSDEIYLVHVNWHCIADACSAYDILTCMPQCCLSDSFQYYCMSTQNKFYCTFHEFEFVSHHMQQSHLNRPGIYWLICHWSQHDDWQTHLKPN